MSFERKSPYDEISDPLEIGSYRQGNYSMFEPSGHLEARGDAVAYRDEYPSHPWVAAGANAAPDQENHTIGGVPRRVWCFNGTTTEESLSSSFEIPHDYAYYPVEGLYLPIEVHAHIRPSTAGSGDIKLFFTWEYSPPQGAPKTHTTQSILSFIKSVDNQQYHNLIVSFTTDLPQDEFNFELGGKIGFAVTRAPTDSEDTYGADMILEQIAMHVPVSDMGSRGIYTK